MSSIDKYLEALGDNHNEVELEKELTINEIVDIWENHGFLVGIHDKEQKHFMAQMYQDAYLLLTNNADNVDECIEDDDKLDVATVIFPIIRRIVNGINKNNYFKFRVVDIYNTLDMCYLSDFDFYNPTEGVGIDGEAEITALISELFIDFYQTGRKHDLLQILR